MGLNINIMLLWYTFCYVFSVFEFQKFPLKSHFFLFWFPPALTFSSFLSHISSDGFFTHGGYTTIEFWKKYFHEVPCRCSHGLLAYRNEYPLNNIERTVDSRLALMKSIKYIDIICRSKTTRDILNIYILIICRN